MAQAARNGRFRSALSLVILWRRRPCWPIAVTGTGSALSAKLSPTFFENSFGHGVRDVVRWAIFAGGGLEDSGRCFLDRVHLLPDFAAIIAAKEVATCIEHSADVDDIVGRVDRSAFKQRAPSSEVSRR